MALNTIVCLAAIIMNLTFLTENICRRLCMRPFALAAMSMIPMLISAAISLVNYFADGFAAFDLNEGAIVPWQVLLCGMDMAIGDILLAKKVAV